MCKKLRELDGLTADEILLLGKVNNYPVDIESVIKSLGIKIDSMDFTVVEEKIPEVISERGTILGAVTIIEDDVNIFYREGSTENRKRFTVAHELAHCCLNASQLKQGHIEFRFDEQTSDPKELAANTFAGQLLVPEQPLKELYDSLLVPAVDVIAKEFKVSIHVMEARLKYLGLGFYSPQNFNPNEA